MFSHLICEAHSLAIFKIPKINTIENKFPRHVPPPDLHNALKAIITFSQVTGLLG